MVSVGPSGQLVLGSIAGLLAAVLLWVLIRAAQSEEEPEYPAERWYTETVDHCEEALDVLDAYETAQGLTHDETRSAMGQVVRQLSTHAGKAVESDVDEAVLTELRSASTACRNLHEAHIEIGDASEWQEAVGRARTTLQSAREAAENNLPPEH